MPLSLTPGASRAAQQWWPVHPATPSTAHAADPLASHSTRHEHLLARLERLQGEGIASGERVRVELFGRSFDAVPVVRGAGDSWSAPGFPVALERASSGTTYYPRGFAPGPDAQTDLPEQIEIAVGNGSGSRVWIQVPRSMPMHGHSGEALTREERAALAELLRRTPARIVPWPCEPGNAMRYVVGPPMNPDFVVSILTDNWRGLVCCRIETGDEQHVVAHVWFPEASPVESMNVTRRSAAGSAVRVKYPMALPPVADVDRVRLTDVLSPSTFGLSEYKRELVKVDDATFDLLRTVQEVLLAVKSHMHYGAGNQVLDVWRTGAESMARMDELRYAIRNQMRYGHEHLLKVARLASEFRAGACYEYTALVYALLVELGLGEVHVVSPSKVDHAYVVVGDPEDPNAVVADAWHLFPGAHLLGRGIPPNGKLDVLCRMPTLMNVHAGIRSDQQVPTEAIVEAIGEALDSGYVNGQEHVLCHSITCVADPSTHYFSDSNPTPTTFDSLPRKVFEHFPEQLLRLFHEVPRSVRANRDLWGMVKDLRYGALDS